MSGAADDTQGFGSQRPCAEPDLVEELGIPCAQWDELTARLLTTVGRALNPNDPTGRDCRVVVGSRGEACMATTVDGIEWDVEAQVWDGRSKSFADLQAIAALVADAVRREMGGGIVRIETALVDDWNDNPADPDTSASLSLRWQHPATLSAEQRKWLERRPA